MTDEKTPVNSVSRGVPRKGPAPDADATVPASQRPIADENGRTSNLHYSAAHIERIKQMKRDGRRVNLPPGVTMDDEPAAVEGSTETSDVGSLTRSESPTGTAGSRGSGE